jgi:hypothetical protein
MSTPYDPIRLLYPEPWENKAACAGHNPAIWDGENPDFTDTAKSICAECPVREQCLNKGKPEHYGIFGGLTAKERKRLGEVA